MVFSVTRDRLVDSKELLAFEDKVWEWSKENPVLWNVGIGPAASFVPTITRLLLQRTMDTCGPYDHIILVRLPEDTPLDKRAQHRLAFDVLTELAATLEIALPEDIKQLGAEESYFGYCEISDNLMLQVFGQEYIRLFGSYEYILNDPIYDLQPERSPIVESTKKMLDGKRHLLLVENMHVPISLDVLVFTMGGLRPSVSKNRRWLISTTSKDVCEDSRYAGDLGDLDQYHLTPEYYYAPPFDDIGSRDWATLIKEALRDAAKSIFMALPDKGDEEFWLHVAQHCLYYGILYHPLQGHGAGAHQASNANSLTSDELVRCWVAEDMLFSTTSPTGVPAATGKKQSKYYRCAYEAGKVVIQALQEYSLLPIYSVSTPKVSTSPSEETACSSSSKDVVTGVSKLAEGVPRLNQDVLNTLVKRNQLRWVSFMNDDGRHVSWGWELSGARRDTMMINFRSLSPPQKQMMTSLILRGCSNISTFCLDKLLTPHLHVLDLSHTPISSLPQSISRLVSLYLLSLRGCTQLRTLSSPPPSTSEKKTSSPLAHLEKLEVLDMNAVPLLELTQQDGSNKSNLHYLDLSGSMFTSLPSEFFCKMSSLEELILSNCTNLKELPLSMAELSNLLVLHVEGTKIASFPENMFQKLQSLHTLKLTNNVLLMSLPLSLSQAKALKELHISNRIRLTPQILWELLPFLENLFIQTWEGLGDIKILGHSNLRTFSLSGPWIRCLSLSGCSKLKSVTFSNDLIALEDVDLSGTSIEEVPHNLLNLPQLTKLLLLGVPCFKRFPWHALVRFPKVFYLDHYANNDNQIPKMFCQQRTCGDENQHEEKTTNIAQVNINDPRMFHSFNADAVNMLVEEGQFLLSFNIQVKPCSVRRKGPQKNNVELSSRVQKHSTYRDVQYSDAASIVTMMKLQPMERHVEISAVNQYPNGFRHILSVTKSMFIMDDNFVRCLTDLNYNFNDLEECQLQRCRQMTVVFLMHSQGSEALPSLQILHVLDLNNLLSVVEPSILSQSTLITLEQLKHIHLEHCPRLEKIFPCSLSLPALETLVILFCSKLKAIFYENPNSEDDSYYDDYEVAPSPLPSIKRMYLHELPQLQHIHDDMKFEFDAPNWEKLFVRGCPSFQRLPLLKKEYPKSKVEVSGEREWWDRLELKLPEQSDYYIHLAPPEFVSRKKHIIQSYLR